MSEVVTEASPPPFDYRAIPWVFCENGVWWPAQKIPIWLERGERARPPFFYSLHVGSRVIIEGPYVGEPPP